MCDDEDGWNGGGGGGGGEGILSASITEECSGKYLLPHKYSFTDPKGSLWDIWGSQKEPSVIRGQSSNWMLAQKA